MKCIDRYKVDGGGNDMGRVGVDVCYKGENGRGRYRGHNGAYKMKKKQSMARST